MDNREQILNKSSWLRRRILLKVEKMLNFMVTGEISLTRECTDWENRNMDFMHGNIWTATFRDNEGERVLVVGGANITEFEKAQFWYIADSIDTLEKYRKIQACRIRDILAWRNDEKAPQMYDTLTGEWKTVSQIKKEFEG